MTVANPALDALPSATLKDLFRLMKPGVMALVVFTGAVGMWLAPGTAHPFIQAIVIAMIALGSGAGGMINMWYDRDIDAIMTRTRTRAIPAGLVSADDVLTVSLMLSVGSVMILGLATNWLAAGLLAFAIAFYGVVYTMWLKRATAHNIVIGGAAGAFPPVIGWAAMAGNLSLEPWILFAIIFLWTPPHFWALALYRNEDYRRAQVPMLPVVKGPAYTARHMEIYCWLLALVCIVPFVLGQVGLPFLVAALLLNGRFILYSRSVRRGLQEPVARRMFDFSILYLFALFAALLADALIAPFLLAI